MRVTNEKFVVRIKIEDREQSSHATIKRNILRKWLPDSQFDDYLSSNFIQDRIVEVAKRTALKHAMQAYVADYEEREGCLEISFLLILETAIIFSHLRHFAEIIKEDIESLFHRHDYYVRGHVLQISSTGHNNRKNRSVIWTLSSFLGCALIALVFLLFNANEHSNSLPNKFELTIKVDSSRSMLNTTNNFIIHKDTVIVSKK